MAKRELNVPLLFSWSQVPPVSRTTGGVPPAGAALNKGPARPRVGRATAVQAPGGNENKIRRLMLTQGVSRMGLVEPKRPVVLIVEDEFLVRMHAVDMIAAAGFQVAEAANADEAIGILEARRDITVVFTDIQMPGS